MSTRPRADARKQLLLYNEPLVLFIQERDKNFSGFAQERRFRMQNQIDGARHLIILSVQTMTSILYVIIYQMILTSSQYTHIFQITLFLNQHIDNMPQQARNIIKTTLLEP